MITTQYHIVKAFTKQKIDSCILHLQKSIGSKFPIHTFTNMPDVEEVTYMCIILSQHFPDGYMSVCYQGANREEGLQEPQWSDQAFLLHMITAPDLVTLESNEWMIGILGHDSALSRLYWARDNLGEWDYFCYESCP